MHGAGNDFVLVNAFEEKLDGLDLSALSVKMCKRQFGIGSDGLILILPSRSASFKMRMFNPDGSESEMCGNGIRCFTKYVRDHNMSQEASMTIETLAGIKHVKITSNTGHIGRVRVDMGAPELRRSLIPMKSSGPQDKVIKEPLRVSGKRFEATCLSMGNPHCVIFVDNIASFPVGKIGPEIEHHKYFPQRTNVPFVQVISRSELGVRVWERGAGETLACGSGACASVVAAVLNEFTGRKVGVQLTGGRLEIEWAGDNRVLMDGPAEEVFSGEFYL